MWTLFDPRDVPLLCSTYGEQFTQAYEDYERTTEVLEKVAAIDLWAAICRSQQESGTPFIMYQDPINGALLYVVRLPVLDDRAHSIF